MHSWHSRREGFLTDVIDSMCGQAAFVIQETLHVPPTNSRANWPELKLTDWIETRDALQLWLQIVGKVRLRLTPPINHSWHSTFYLTARGLTTSPIPYGNRSFHLDLDLMDHRLLSAATDGASGGFALQAQSVAAFYARLMDELTRLGLPVRIFPKPNELRSRSRFPTTTGSGRTIRTRCIGSGSRFRRPIACSKNSGRISSESAVPSTCSGAGWTWP